MSLERQLELVMYGIWCIAIVVMISLFWSYFLGPLWDAEKYQAKFILPTLGIQQAEAAPYYSSGDHKIRLVVKFQNDCWHEIYARATPKNNNQVILNKQTIRNNDEPDNGPSETLTLKWFFKDSKMQATKSTNENRLRTYVTIELTEDITGATVTKYLPYDPSKETTDFGTFLMPTNPALCQ